MDSLLRLKISNQYNLLHYQKMNFNQIKKISEEKQIPIDDLLKLFDISGTSGKRLETQEENYAYIRIYSIDELKEIEKNIVKEVIACPQMNEERLEMLEQKYKISKIILKKMLKIDNNTYYRKIKQGKIIELKFKDSKTSISLDKTFTTREKIKKIKLDLKHIQNYGNRFYDKQELSLMAYNYGIEIHELLLYLAHGKILYHVYENAYENNPKGVWLGGECRLSNEAIEKNYEELNKYIKRIAYNICNMFGDFSQLDELKSEAWENIIRKCRNI